MTSTSTGNMRSLCFFAYTDPSKYEIASIPAPKVTLPNHVLVQVFAASINPVDIAGASGKMKSIVSTSFPHKLGSDFSGIVAEVGSSVTKWNVGDEVFSCVSVLNRGSISEYALTTEDIIAIKLKNLSHIEAASLPLVSFTALQALEKVTDRLEGRTVLVPAGLSGVGSVACQMAKNGFGAAKVITTVSTEKVKKIVELLGEGVVDEVIDHKISDPLRKIPEGSIDVLFDTANVTMSYLPLVAKTGIIIACTSLPSGQDLKIAVPSASYLLQSILNLVHVIVRWRVERHGPKYDSVCQAPNGVRLERIKGWVEAGKLKPIVGKVIKPEDIEAIREAYNQIRSGKGGIGKVVIVVDDTCGP